MPVVVRLPSFGDSHIDAGAGCAHLADSATISTICFDRLSPILNCGTHHFAMLDAPNVNFRSYISKSIKVLSVGSFGSKSLIELKYFGYSSGPVKGPNLSKYETLASEGAFHGYTDVLYLPRMSLHGTDDGGVN